MNIKEYIKNNKQKTIWILVGALVLGLILGVSYGKNKSKNSVQEVVPVENKEVVDSTALAPKTPVRYTAPKPTLSYGTAVELYKDHRIQVGENCYATPRNVTWKNSTEFMLDNRSAKARVFTIQGKTYSIAPWGFSIIPLAFNKASLPQTILVDCTGFQNVATIIIQN